MSEIREGDFTRQDGHDPEHNQGCATGLCEHERGPAFPAPKQHVRSEVMAAFWRGLIYRDGTGSEDQS
jgi:hypothetical protein